MSKVLENLHELAKNSHLDDWYDDRFVCELCQAIGIRMTSCNSDIVNRLADLIEPQPVSGGDQRRVPHV